jgi:dipeptidyl aminopeptidase/acylaminoacyl peptidase
VNRGYVVFKPNFRASTGYGVNYVKATRGDFGKEGVLDDIITGLDYLIANGIGNAKQQAVVGHSFGGYTSLLAVTHHPDRFAFAVPSAAPVDMAWTMADIAIEGGSALSVDGPPIEVLFPGYGVPYRDKAWHDRMHRESPLAHADELRTPVYLWAGAKDDRVAVESLVRYFAESNTDFTPTLLIDPDAGHSPRERLNVEALIWLIEASADRHFDGGVTPPSAALKTFLEKNLRTGNASLLKRD